MRADTAILPLISRWSWLKILQGLYFCGLRVWMGDPLNGIRAEVSLDKADKAWMVDGRIGQWLHETAIRIYPDSAYAARTRPREGAMTVQLPLDVDQRRDLADRRSCDQASVIVGDSKRRSEIDEKLRRQTRRPGQLGRPGGLRVNS